MQILRSDHGDCTRPTRTSTTPITPTPPGRLGHPGPGPVRPAQAIIERAEEQLKRTPNAVQLHQALADYYKAAGQRDKARAELARIAELRPDDADLRLQVGTQLVQDGQAAGAIEHYKAALKKDPSVSMRSYYQIENAFRQANKTGELLELLEQIDIRKLGQPYYIIEH